MQNRRDFLRSVGRSIAVLLILVVGSVFAFRENEEQENCNFDFVCNNCKDLNKCKLPQAKAHKKNK